MKVTCKLNTYYKWKNQGDFTLASDDQYWLRDGTDRPDYKLQYRLEIMTNYKNLSNNVLASKIIEVDTGSQKMDIISFSKITYIFFHQYKRICCNTLEQKI